MRKSLRILSLSVLIFGCNQDQSQPDASIEQEAGMESTTQSSSESISIAEQEAAVRRNPLKDVYFGELHLHTAYSLDAYIFGNAMNDPFQAYRFAKGEQINLPSGVSKRIKTPLDFAAITDHAEALGEFEICTNSSMSGYDSETCKGVRANDIRPFQQIFAGIAAAVPKRLEGICGPDGSACTAAVSGP